MSARLKARLGSMKDSWHAAKHPAESFNFQEFERVLPAQNARHQINDVDYRKTGGNIPYP